MGVQGLDRDFVWQVARDGYFLGGGPPGTWLQPKGPALRDYRPLREHSGLFRTFAALPPSADGALAFAGRFGLLTRDRPGPGADVAEGWLHALAGPGDLVATWAEQIRAMHGAVEVWLQVRHAGKPTTNLLLLQERVNHELARAGTAGRLARGRRGEWRLGIAPGTLQGALWCQLAAAVAGDKEFERCAKCGDFLEVPATKPHAERRYCSVRCRMQAYRARQEQARQMAAGGRKPAEIARDLGTDAKTVRGWLKGG